MISEGSCDTEDGCSDQINYQINALIKIKILLTPNFWRAVYLKLFLSITLPSMCRSEAWKVAVSSMCCSRRPGVQIMILVRWIFSDSSFRSCSHWKRITNYYTIKALTKICKNHTNHLRQERRTFPPITRPAENSWFLPTFLNTSKVW